MPLPLLVPAIGALVGTAAAPALGMSAAVAAGLGSGIASLAAGADPEEALFAGLTGGVGAGLMPGVTSGVQAMAGKGAAQAAGQGATQAAGAGVEALTKSTIDSLAKQGLGKAGGSGIAGLNIDPKKATEMGLRTMAASGAGGGETSPQFATASTMSPGGAQGVSSSDALANFPTAAASAPTAAPHTENLAVEPVHVASVLEEEKRIPLQTVPQIRTAANGGLMSMAKSEMQARGLDRLPNLGDRSQAYQMAQYARGGYIQGPGTVTSDDVDGMIYQSGQPVEHIKVADGEVILSGKDLASLDPDGDHERAGRRIGNAPNGTRGKKAAELFMKMQEAA